MVIVDTSVWIDFFKKKKSPNEFRLEWLIEEGTLAINLPIYCEVLSGQMSHDTRIIVERGLKSCAFLDLNWQDQAIWSKIAGIADKAYSNRIPACGVIDRMIVISAIEMQASILTLDKPLAKLSDFFGVLSPSDL